MVAHMPESGIPEIKANYTIPEVAERLGISAWLVRDMINRGELEAVRIGPRLLRIPGREIERLESNTVKSVKDWV